MATPSSIFRGLERALCHVLPAGGKNGAFCLKAGLQLSAGHKRRIPLAVVLPRPARGAGTLIPSAQRFVWAAKQPLGADKELCFMISS